MRYTVLLREQPAGKYIAIAPAIPDCRGEGRTRNEALERLRLTLEDWLSRIEVTSVEVSTPLAHPEVQGNPWLATAGSFADDATLARMLHDIYAERSAERLAA